MTSCLIIGCGSSYDDFVLNKLYDVDLVIGIHKNWHKQVSVVCSHDLKLMEEKELIALKDGCKLILQHNQFQKHQQKKIKQICKEKNYNIESFVGKYQLTSGFTAIEWAIKNNYKTLYTVGLDFNEPTINKVVLNKVNQLIKEYEKKDIKIYKWSEKSLLNCPLKLPSST